MSPVFNSEEERLAYLISVDAMEGIKQLNEFSKLITDAQLKLQALTKVAQEFARITGVSFNQARQSIGQLDAAYKQAVASGNALGGGVGGGIGGMGGGGGFGTPSMTTYLDEIPPKASTASSALERLGTTFRHVIIGMIAFRVIQFFMDLVNGIGAATKAAEEFYKSLVNLEMGVRAMQRAGFDVTLGDFLKAIQDLKKEFPIFTEAQLASGFENAILKTAQMKMSTEDVIKLMQISAGVAAVTGKSMESVTDALINAMLSSSGRMTITLAEATNLQINQADIVRKAKELQITSIEKGIKALSDEERKTVILALAWEQYQKKQDDINASMKTVPATVDAVSASWTDLKNKMGTFFLEIEAKFAPYIVTFLTWIIKELPQILQLIIVLINLTATLSNIILGLGTGFVSMLYSIRSGVGGVKGAIKAFIDGFKTGFNELYVSLQSVVAGATDVGGQIEDTFSNTGKKSGKAFGEGFSEGLTFTEDQQNALDDFAKNVEQMSLDMARKLEQDKIDLGRKLSDIDANYAQTQIQSAIDAARAVADINENASQSIEDANQKYHENELKAEEDYQRQLQKLRDQFLFDLEDALRTQDAGQIRRLIRKYQLDKKNLAEDNKNQSTDREKQYQQELADIEKQRQRKLADAARDAEYKRQKDYENWQRDRADALLRYQQDQEDTARQNKYKLQDMIDALADLGLATATGAEAVRLILMQYFGPGGYTDVIYAYLIAQVQNAVIAMAFLNAMAKGGKDIGNPIKPGSGTIKKDYWASGGAMIASRPTTAVFGEGGEPELAVFLPLSKIRNPVGNASIRNGGNASGKINLEVLLSPDLEARIVRQAADNVATTITKIQREK